MIAVPRIREVKNGQILSTNLVNNIIKRTEYAADLLGQHKLITGENISLKQLFDGTRINATIKAQKIIFVLPPSGLVPPIDPPLLECTGSIGWSINNLGGGPYTPPKTGYIVSAGRWSITCLNNSSLFPKATYSLNADDGGFFGSDTLPTVPAPNIPTKTAVGVVVPNATLYDDETFYLWVEWLVFDLYQGGFGLTGSGVFKLN